MRRLNTRARDCTWSCDKFTLDPMDEDFIYKVSQMLTKVNIASSPMSNWDFQGKPPEDHKVAECEMKVNMRAFFVNSRNKRIKRMCF